MKARRYVTPYRYAQLCEVSTQAIYSRIKSKSLQVVDHVELGGGKKKYIDTDKFPPSKGKKIF